VPYNKKLREAETAPRSFITGWISLQKSTSRKMRV